MSPHDSFPLFPRPARQREKRKQKLTHDACTLQNDKYLSSSLPFPFENKDQFERSLRLPIGQEWITRQSFQDSTKPRVIIKQGVIAPMSKPMA